LYRSPLKKVHQQYRRGTKQTYKEVVVIIWHIEVEIGSSKRFIEPLHKTAFKKVEKRTEKIKET